MKAKSKALEDVAIRVYNTDREADAVKKLRKFLAAIKAGKVRVEA